MRPSPCPNPNLNPAPTPNPDPTPNQVTLNDPTLVQRLLWLPSGGFGLWSAEAQGEAHAAAGVTAAGVTQLACVRKVSYPEPEPEPNPNPNPNPSPLTLTRPTCATTSRTPCSGSGASSPTSADKVAADRERESRRAPLVPYVGCWRRARLATSGMILHRACVSTEVSLQIFVTHILLESSMCSRQTSRHRRPPFTARVFHRLLLRCTHPTAGLVPRGGPHQNIWRVVR